MASSLVKKLFSEGDLVRHRKGGYYIIVLTPADCIIEAGVRPAYAYRPKGELAPVWVRPQTEMEDGRFTLVEQGFTP